MTLQTPSSKPFQATTSTATAGTVVAARQAVGLGDARTLRRYLETVQETGGAPASVVNERSCWRMHLLHLATFEGSVDTVNLLLAAGASVNAQDLDGWTPLHYAARDESKGGNLVRSLAAAGAEVNKVENRGRTALHIAYLCRNGQAVSELLEHGASTTVRDRHGKTAVQMLQQRKPSRRRPWSGSSTIPGGSFVALPYRAGSPCQVRPCTATSNVEGSTRRSLVGDDEENLKMEAEFAFTSNDEMKKYPSTPAYSPTQGDAQVWERRGYGVADGRQAEEPLGAEHAAGVAIHERIFSVGNEEEGIALDGRESALQTEAPLFAQSGARCSTGSPGLPSPSGGAEKVHAEGSLETTVVGLYSEESWCCDRAVASCCVGIRTPCAIDDENVSPSRREGAKESQEECVDAPLPSRVGSSVEDDPKTEKTRGGREISKNEKGLSATGSTRGGGLYSADIGREAALGGGGGLSDHRDHGPERARHDPGERKRPTSQRRNRRRQAGQNGGRRGKANRPARLSRSKSSRARNASSSVVKHPLITSDQIPDYVVGEKRWAWAQKSAARYARLTVEALRRREQVRNRPYVFGTPKSPDAGVRPSSSPTAICDPTGISPFTNGPYGGRSCINYRLARKWMTSPADGSEMWWAKDRFPGMECAAVVKIPKKQGGEWDAFIREWGALKYLQEEGWVDGRKPQSVGLLGAFEIERSLVLSVPTGSRTLREVGERMHCEREKNGNMWKSPTFEEKVESLAAQACRAVCWLHRCGLISGEITPDNFVVPGGNQTDARVKGSGTKKRTAGWNWNRESAGHRRSDLRLLTARVVGRRSDATGGCPRHPLLELVRPEFPCGEPFDGSYAPPERLKAAASGVPCKAEAAVDAWGLGMTVHWLLTGREYVIGSTVDFGFGAQSKPSPAKDRSGDKQDGDRGERPQRREGRSPVTAGMTKAKSGLERLGTCLGKVCSLLPELLSIDPRLREIALGIADKHSRPHGTFRSPSSPQTRCSVRSPPVLYSSGVKPLESPRTISTPASIPLLRAPPPAGHDRGDHDETKRPTSRTINPDATSPVGRTSPPGPASMSPALPSETTAYLRRARFDVVAARREARTKKVLELDPHGTVRAAVTLEALSKLAAASKALTPDKVERCPDTLRLVGIAECTGNEGRTLLVAAEQLHLRRGPQHEHHKFHQPADAGGRGEKVEGESLATPRIVPSSPEQVRAIAECQQCQGGGVGVASTAAAAAEPVASREQAMNYPDREDHSDKARVEERDTEGSQTLAVKIYSGPLESYLMTILALFERKGGLPETSLSQLFKSPSSRNCRSVEDGAGSSHSTRPFATGKSRLGKSASSTLNVEAAGLTSGAEHRPCLTHIGHFSDAVGTDNKQGVVATEDDVRNKLAIRDSSGSASAGFDEVDRVVDAEHMSVLSPHHSDSAVSRDGKERDECFDRGEVNSGLEERLVVFPEGKGLGRAAEWMDNADIFPDARGSEEAEHSNAISGGEGEESGKTEGGGKGDVSRHRVSKKTRSKRVAPIDLIRGPHHASTNNGGKGGREQTLRSATSAGCSSGAGVDFSIHCGGSRTGNEFRNNTCCNLM